MNLKQILGELDEFADAAKTPSNRKTFEMADVEEVAAKAAETVYYYKFNDEFAKFKNYAHFMRNMYTEPIEQLISQKLSLQTQIKSQQDDLVARIL